MKRIDIALAVGLVLLSGFYFYHALELPQGMSRGSPRAGTLPFFLGILMIGASLIYLAQAVLAQRKSLEADGVEEESNSQMPAGTLVLFGIICAYAVALLFLGFVVATVLFVLGTLRLFFNASWVVSMAAAFIITASCYVTFEYGLKLSLPPAQLF